MDPVEGEFEHRLRDSIHESISLGYNPTRLSGMRNSWGGVGTAKRLVASGEIQDGIRRIVEMGHPELSMESIMLEPQFASLFTEGELQAARWRRDQLL